MKIGEKRTWKKGKGILTIERIKFDWKALIAWIIFFGLLFWYLFLR